MEKIYSVAELAHDLGVTPRTVRFYEEQGLIAPQRAGNTRVYTHRDQVRMVLILRGKRMGFSLKEIKEFLDLYDADPSQVGQNQLLLTKVRGRIALLEDQLQTIQTTLVDLREMERLSIERLRSKGVTVS